MAIRDMCMWLSINITWILSGYDILDKCKVGHSEITHCYYKSIDYSSFNVLEDKYFFGLMIVIAVCISGSQLEFNYSTSYLHLAMSLSYSLYSWKWHFKIKAL